MVEAVQVYVHRIRLSNALKRDQLMLQFRIECAPNAMNVPSKKPPLRVDGLWKTTCAELFIKGEGPSYHEFNFSPSTEWAAYRFASYRENLGGLAFEQPPMVCAGLESFGLLLDATVQLDMFDDLQLGLSAVIEETDGTKSYWALRHPPGPPDFHHPDCFALTLPAPGAA